MHPIEVERIWQTMAGELARDPGILAQYRRFERRWCPARQRLNRLGLQLMAVLAVAPKAFGYEPFVIPAAGGAALRQPA